MPEPRLAGLAEAAGILTHRSDCVSQSHPWLHDEWRTRRIVGPAQHGWRSAHRPPAEGPDRTGLQARRDPPRGAAMRCGATTHSARRCGEPKCAKPGAAGPSGQHKGRRRPTPARSVAISRAGMTRLPGGSASMLCSGDYHRLIAAQLGARSGRPWLRFRAGQQRRRASSPRRRASWPHLLGK